MTRESTQAAMMRQFSSGLALGAILSREGPLPRRLQALPVVFLLAAPAGLVHAATAEAHATLHPQLLRDGLLGQVTSLGAGFTLYAAIHGVLGTSPKGRRRSEDPRDLAVVWGGFLAEVALIAALPLEA